MAQAKNTVRTTVPPGENLVRSVNTPSNQIARATTHNRVHLVHLARRNFQGTRDHTPTPERTMRLGPARYRGQMQDVPIQPNLDAQCKGRIRNSRVDAQVGSHRHTGEPSERERDPNQDGLQPPICHT
jgi:hypothetical protein